MGPRGFPRIVHGKKDWRKCDQNREAMRKGKIGNLMRETQEGGADAKRGGATRKNKNKANAT